MYVITHHHDYDEVLLGPIDWNPRYIASVIQSDLDLDYLPSVVGSDIERIPYEIVPNVIARKVEIVNEEHDPKTQFLVGPYWTFEEEKAIARYTAADKNIDIVKSELKQVVASKRYEKEVSGTKVTIKNQEIDLDTNRESRQSLYTKYSLMDSHATIDWKSTTGWLAINKYEFETMVKTIDNHVQNCFSWEFQKNQEIDACTTLEELKNLDLQD